MIPSQPQPAPPPISILLVEDDPLTQQLVRGVLQQTNEIHSCDTLHQAVNDYLRLQPDLVLLDIDLGDSDFNGFDVLATLRLYDPRANVVILTAHDSPANIRQASLVGAHGFIAKPFTRERLLQCASGCAQEKARRHES